MKREQFIKTFGVTSPTFRTVTIDDNSNIADTIEKIKSYKQERGVLIKDIGKNNEFCSVLIELEKIAPKTKIHYGICNKSVELGTLFYIADIYEGSFVYSENIIKENTKDLDEYQKDRRHLKLFGELYIPDEETGLESLLKEAKTKADILVVNNDISPRKLEQIKELIEDYTLFLGDKVDLSKLPNYREFVDGVFK